MANELTVTCGIVHNTRAWSQGGQQVSFDQNGTTKPLFVKGVIVVPTVETQLDLGVLGGAVLGRYHFRNLDAVGTSSYVHVRISASGSNFLKLAAGEPSCGRFGSSVTALYLIAVGAAVGIEYAIFEAV
jgi:hypothetical protein